MGVMPVERGEIGKITFSWTSKPMFYAYGFYVITTVVVLLGNVWNGLTIQQNSS